MTSSSIDYVPWMPTTTSITDIPKQYQSVDAPVPAPEPATSTTSATVDSRKVRAWAISQGIPVGKRGRIKPDVIARYTEAHGA